MKFQKGQSVWYVREWPDKNKIEKYVFVNYINESFVTLGFENINVYTTGTADKNRVFPSRFAAMVYLKLGLV